MANNNIFDETTSFISASEIAMDYIETSEMVTDIMETSEMVTDHMETSEMVTDHMETSEMVMEELETDGQIAMEISETFGVRPLSFSDWGLSFYLCMVFMLAGFGNGMVIYLTSKHYQFHQPYMYLKCAYAAADIGVNAGLTIVISNIHFTGIPSWITCQVAGFSLGMFWVTIHMTAFMSLERYFYFCKPLIYTRYFTLKTILVVFLISFTISQAYVYVTEYMYGRTLQPLFYMCQLDGSIHNTFQIVFNLIPCALCICYSVYKIHKLINKIKYVTMWCMHENQVILYYRPRKQIAVIYLAFAILKRDDNNMAVNVQGVRKESVQKSLRLILLISGSFWLTLVPGFFIRAIVLQMGYTWDTLNSYETPAISNLLRFGQFTPILSTVLDPLIYFGVSHDLRAAFLKCFKIRAQFSWEN